MPPSLNYVQRRESNPRDALLQLYLTERNRAAVIKLTINNGNANFLIDFLAAGATFFSCFITGCWYLSAVVQQRSAQQIFLLHWSQQRCY